MKTLVYVVDDEQELGEMFSEFLTDENITVKAFANPQEALNKAQEEKPDLYFLDYRMPKIDGDELAKKLPPQGDKYLVTGEISPSPSFSFKGIISKPYNFKDIKALLSNYGK